MYSGERVPTEGQSNNLEARHAAQTVPMQRPWPRHARLTVTQDYQIWKLVSDIRYCNFDRARVAQWAGFVFSSR
jgi:hypothetical protein